MKTISIGFSKSAKKFAIGSIAIRAYMQTDYSHVYIKFYSKSLDRTLIYEAVGSGVRFIGQEKWKNHAIEMHSYDLEISDESYIKLIQFCVDNAGEEYAFCQNLGVVIAKMFNLEKNPFQKGQNCSEITGELLKLEGFRICKDINLATPKDIKRILDHNQDKATKNTEDRLG